MTISIETAKTADEQRTEFQNATLQSTPDGALAFSIATHVTGGLSSTTEDDLARELHTLLASMAKAAGPYEVSFEVQIGREG